MKNSVNHVFLFLILSTVICSQNFSTKLSGRVVDSSSGEPLPNTNVYISQTTFGTTTDLKGRFELKNFPPGSHEIVFSMIGYEISTKLITIFNNKSERVNVSLKPISYELEEILVKAEKPGEWYDNLRLFKKLFLGKTSFAKDCTIENPEYLSFSKGENYNFYASSAKPIIVI